ncbi:Yip1 family protein [Bacillus rubiinfantis]|uniref:Yip1 family protein n=1 Tax=Bacillus rubiinfantis TaxID=1499680 RepID=UPI00069419DC|nr:Yip1 family protein [Bacillus rubiinfantis]
MEVKKEMNINQEKPTLFGMFTNPSVQFEKIRQNPKIWLPLLIVTILYVIGTVFMAAMLDVQLLIDQGVPKDQAELALGFTKIVTAVTGVFTPIIGILVSSVVQLFLSKFGSSSVTFKQLFSMNTFIMIIGAVGMVINMAIRYAIGGSPEIYLTSIAGLLNQETSGVLSALEVFSIWSTILTAFGLQKTAGLSKGLAWTIAILFFLVSIGFTLVGTAFQGAPSL